MIQLSPRHKRLLKWVGYPLLAFVVFIVAVFQTFPYERLRDKIVEVVSQRYDITISEISPTLIPGGIVLTSVTLQDRPEDSEQVPSMLFFEEIEIDVGLMSLLFGGLNVDLVAETASGSIEGSVVLDALDIKKAHRLEVEVETENLQLGGIPGVREAVGLPVTGGMTAEFRLELPELKFKNAEGYFRFTCGGCTIGDGVSKIKPRLPESKKNDPRYKRRLAMYGDGLTVPQLSLGATEADIEIEKGIGKIKKLRAVSPDGELAIEGEIRFEDPFKNTTLPGCMKFKLSEELKKREEKFGNIDMLLDAKRGDDGFFAFPTKGTLLRLQWSTKKPCKGAGAEPEEDRPTRRPTIRSRRDSDDSPSTPASRAGRAASADDKSIAPSSTPSIRRRDAGVGSRAGLAGRRPMIRDRDGDDADEGDDSAEAENAEDQEEEVVEADEGEDERGDDVGEEGGDPQGEGDEENLDEEVLDTAD